MQKSRNPGESCFASRSKRKEKQKNQQKLIVTTENCSNDEINIDCGCENTSSIFLTLVRLRLGLLKEDIADRFGISPTLSSRIFTTWMRVLSKLLGHALITWLPEEAVLVIYQAFLSKLATKDVVLRLIGLRYL